MAKKLTLNQLRQKYNILEEKARENYLNETGLKIARGFKDTDEYKDIQRRKNWAVRRKKRIESKAKAVEIFKSEPDGAPMESDELTEVQKEAGVKGLTWIAENELFYNALSYGGKNLKVIQDTYNDLTGQGKEVTVVVFSYPSDVPVSTTTETSFLLEIEKLYASLMDAEEKEEKYPTVDIINYSFQGHSVISVRARQETDWIEKIKE